ncbi:hypothetical protein SERLA73DRAFT_187766 [Serpula lacrymans var. lacrymans S7.3]|uniref:Galactose oxidase n=2 Tax=Serpula lacrymans var. lacrymans TaxID=341189 RepID=F8QAB8_SERL3|nr:uncharacterized protein SERLADRAFT_477557 [Serpula lacrymans var. lacrymans S7.9]EGN94708.1 hypothetical protein SERLA73DRAFT_187766 [Serpula lacrymans var. lacrymans S7.3]EGO20187.1 hypothetical protein SERLADRAFT_477557 [Serpula lacrymans var. lacrymans S7.9]
MVGPIGRQGSSSTARAAQIPTLNELFNDDDGLESMSGSRTPSLSDVPEESLTPPVTVPSPNLHSPYLHATHQATASTSTFNASVSIPGTPRMSTGPRKPSNLRPNGDRPPPRSTSDSVVGISNGSTSLKKRASSPGHGSSRDGKTIKGREQKIRNIPRLPRSDDIDPAPATNMYWSKAPVHGALPMRNMRAHSVTLVESLAWLFGGCDDKGCWKDVYCFDTETMQWSHPEMVGEVPPPCRAHTATLVQHKIVVFGGGQGPVYYNDTYILDTVARRWIHPTFDHVPPAPRRAHTAVLYNSKIWIFGGGNGLQALNDVWTLDVGVSIDKMRWEQVETTGKPPKPRGYHTANLVGSVMVVIGGSDGKECFSDVWCLNLETLVWTQISLQVSHRRLSHTATQVGSYLFIVGGHDGSSYTNELLLYNLAVSLQYEPRQISGKAPSPRGYHVTLIADSRLFVFGGFNGHDVYDDVHILDLAGAAYLPQVMSFSIDV